MRGLLMSHRHTTTNATGASILSRLAILLAAACLILAAHTGCDSQELTDNSSEDNQEQNQNQNQNQHNHNQDEIHEHDADYYEAHGPDDDEVLVDAGSLQGSWRVGFVDGDVPLTYFDIFHDDGETTADGDFMAGIAIADMQDGNTGSIESITIDGENVEIEWNQTDADEELYSLALEREDDDNYTGVFSAAMYPNTHDVTMKRTNVD